VARQVNLIEAETKCPIDQKRRDEIAAGLRRMFGLELNVSAKEWNTLEATLNNFRKSFIDWDGYLNKGEIAKVRAIASKATKLKLAVEQAQQRGLGKIIEYELGPTTSDQLLASLELLSKIEPISPKTLDGKNRMDVPYHVELKADLQLWLDSWWVRVTGSPAETEEAKVTPFSFFLAQISKALPSEVASDLGCSRSAINTRRRNAARRQARNRNISAAFEKLHSTKFQEFD
tara:strand:+ start:1748 stop:2443 length:696 start_codon:yes stop_codon:yes gene_type:complete